MPLRDEYQQFLKVAKERPTVSSRYLIFLTNYYSHAMAHYPEGTMPEYLPGN